MATMFPCPNCGGQLRYQPETRKLKCVSCGEFQEPSEYVPDGKIGTEELNTNVYICPNCAGQIQLIDNDGMEFCPFCGTQATMQEHFSSEGVPDYILPFRINKKEAKTSFAKSTKRVHFKPDGLDKDENVDKLVGMYVPYYLYDFNINDSFKYQGKKSYTQGEYNITDYANVDVQAKVDSLKVPFDASQTLDDSVAVELEPYPLEQVEKFNPNYLAGFFVENSTVEKDLYKEDSLEKAIDCVYGQVKQQTGEYTPSSSDEKTIKEKLRASIRRTDTTGAYLPVYFLTTRYGDRVAYSMVNGTTGNCYVDMPIEKKKLFSASMVVSLIIFVVLLALSFFLSFSYVVQSLCSVSALISSAVALIGAKFAAKAYRKDNHLDDKGFFKSKEEVANSEKEAKKKSSSSKNEGFYTIAIIAVAILIFGLFEIGSNAFVGLISVFNYVVSVILIIAAILTVGKGDKKVLMFGIIGWAISVLIRIINPVADIFYYIAMIATFLVLISSMSFIVDVYNQFATRPSPQFMKKGGGLENANR